MMAISQILQIYYNVRGHKLSFYHAERNGVQLAHLVRFQANAELRSGLRMTNLLPWEV